MENENRNSECSNVLKKLPWAGYSLNLIEYFCIIGLEVVEIKNEILQLYTYNHKSEFNPQVISSVISDTDNMLENKQIVEIVFPKKINLVNSKEQPLSSSFIFSINADSYTNKKKKVPFYGTCYLFYEPLANYFKFEEDRKMYNKFEKDIPFTYVPKAFCIISQYPYFSIFNQINKEIHSVFENKTEVPVEVLVHNLVYVLPSPIDYSIVFNILNKEILIPQLSGYPVLDFNLSEIFNILGISYIVELYILFMLDFDMIFFSQNIELLNFTMYMFSALSYPCNDSFHNWYNFSISLEEFENPECMYATRPFAMMIGVNEKYSNNINTSKVKNAAHIVVDLDERRFVLKYLSKDEEEQNKFVNFLTNIKYIKTINDKLTFLPKLIKTLMTGLENIPKLYSVRDSTSRGYCINQSNYQMNLFEVNDKIRNLNKNIQELFYNFNLNLFSIYSNFLIIDQNPQINESPLNLKLNLEYKLNSEKMNNEELIFTKFIQNSQKFKSYIENYMKFHECLDLYKIPYIFFDEFIYYKKNLDEKNFPFFDIIDNFYLTGKKIEIRADKMIEFFTNHLKYKIFYNKASQDKFCRFLIRNPDSLTYEYSICKLENFILNNYIYNVHNNIFNREKLEAYNYKRTNFIRNSKYSQLGEHIENSFTSSQVIKMDQYIIMSLLIIFITTVRTRNFRESTNNVELRSVLDIISTKKTIFFKKYVFLLLKEIIRLPDSDIIVCISIIINFMRNNNIIPNEIMLNLIKEMVTNENSENNQSNFDRNPESYINNYRDYLRFNFCSCGFKKDEYFIKSAEKCTTDCNIYVDCAKCRFDKKSLEIVLKFNELNYVFTSELFSPFKLFNQSNQILEEFNLVDHFHLLDPVKTNKVILNLIFYCKHFGFNYRFLIFYLRAQ